MRSVFTVFTTRFDVTVASADREPGRAGDRLLADADVAHHGAPRPAPAPRDERVHLGGRTLEDGLDPAVGQVPHAARETGRAGLAAHATRYPTPCTRPDTSTRRRIVSNPAQILNTTT